MDTLMHSFVQLHIEAFAKALLLILFGFILARVLSNSLEKLIVKKISPHLTMIVRGTTFYIILLLFIISAVQQLGFKISTLLGATGILTVALGIASQTSMSNLVSGIFIIGEKPFALGDLIKINDIQGEVFSIDFLSVKIRASDNTIIRIPNETLIKSAIINLSYFPMRRIDLVIGVAYKEDIDHVRHVFLRLADANPLSLKDPKPFIAILDFGESAINIQFSIWTAREHYNELKNRIQEQIKMAFEKQGIELPFPARTLYTGNLSSAFSTPIAAPPPDPVR